MRRRVSSGGVTVQGIAGTRAIYFGIDLDANARPGCKGFAIHRTDDTAKKPRWLSGFKTFFSVEPNPDPTKFYSSQDHPVQSFYWGDYTVRPGHDYTYRFVPRYGAPGSLQDQSGVEATIQISASDPEQGTHGIYFNRGVAASQAYAEQFGATPSKLSDAKRQEALDWLSRGLAEAIKDFIGQASSEQFALRAAVYEFTDPGVLDAFKQADQNGVDVKIVYHAMADEEGDANRTAIQKAGLPASILIERTKSANIAHNKFIVLCRKGSGGSLAPLSVWTGSTNLSQGGIYGHSNVGHAVRDGNVAAQFLGYWQQLAEDPDKDVLRDWVSANSPFDANAFGPAGISTLFSPRHGYAPLNWYASEYGGIQVMAGITEAFGVGTVFENAITSYTGNGLHYVMLDSKDNNQDAWSTDHKVFVAVGSKGGPDILRRWAKETLTGFNTHVPYLHTKFLMVDPLSADPTIITGSANFSPNSTNANDENMLVIRGDQEAADVYFTEFTRIFQHFYARWWASQLNKSPADAQTHSFLDETDDWQTPYFTAGNPKDFVRKLFSSQVLGNV